MSQFLARSLERLSDVFGIKGSQVSTDQIDLTDIQLVADVLKLAGQGGQQGIGFAGYGFYVLNEAHAAAGDLIQNTAVYTGWSDAVAAWPDPVPRECDLWITAVGAALNTDAAGAGDFRRCQITTLQDAATRIGGGPAALAPRTVLFDANQTGVSPTGVGVAFPLTPNLSGMLSAPVKLHRAVQGSPGGNAGLQMITTSAGANAFTVQAYIEVLALARGLHPYG